MTIGLHACFHLAVVCCQVTGLSTEMHKCESEFFRSTAVRALHCLAFAVMDFDSQVMLSPESSHEADGSPIVDKKELGSPMGSDTASPSPKAIAEQESYTHGYPALAVATGAADGTEEGGKKTEKTKMKTEPASTASSSTKGLQKKTQKRMQKNKDKKIPKVEAETETPGATSSMTSADDGLGTEETIRFVEELHRATGRSYALFRGGGPPIATFGRLAHGSPPRDVQQALRRQMGLE